MMAIADEKDTRAMSAVNVFCSKAYGDHGKKRTTGEHKGWFEHDWGDLVQTISCVDYGHIQKIPEAWLVGNMVRKEYRNNPDWNVRVNLPGVHERILTLIRAGLTVLESQREKYGMLPRT